MLVYDPIVMRGIATMPILYQEHSLGATFCLQERVS